MYSKEICSRHLRILTVIDYNSLSTHVNSKYTKELFNLESAFSNSLKERVIGIIYVF